MENMTPKIINTYLEKMETHFAKSKYFIPSDEYREKIQKEMSIDEKTMRLFRKFGRHLLQKSTDHAQKEILKPVWIKPKKVLWLRREIQKPVVLLMRLHMPKYKDDPELARRYAHAVLPNLDPNHVRAKKLLASKLLDLKVSDLTEPKSS